MECKSFAPTQPFVAKLELIDTLWNVNEILNGFTRLLGH